MKICTVEEGHPATKQIIQLFVGVNEILKGRCRIIQLQLSYLKLNTKYIHIKFSWIQNRANEYK